VEAFPLHVNPSINDRVNSQSHCGILEINQALLITEIGASREQDRINGVMENLQKLVTEPYLARG
jgi:hypothetical protein